MAELATIARPYAEALLKASANGDAATLAGEIRALADVAANPQMRLFADSPKIDATQVFDLLTGVAGTPSGAPLSDAAKNLLRTVIDNGRLVALARDRDAVPGARRRAHRRLAGDDRKRVPDRRDAGRRRQGGDGAALRAGSSRRASSSSPS